MQADYSRQFGADMTGTLDGTVDVPIVGKQPKKLMVGGGLVVGVLVVVYYVRKKKTAAVPPAATTSDQYPPDGTVGNPSDLYSTDPATNQTYGDEAAGSGGTYGAYGNGAASGQYYDPTTGAYDLSSPYGTGGTGVSSGNPATPGGPPFANNAAWADWVIQELQAQNVNLDVGALTDALGIYLNGQVPTPAQKTLIFDATAIAGNPPITGESGYPPKVKAPAQPGHETTVQVPKVTGRSATSAVAKLTAVGLVAGSEGKNGGTAIVNSQTPGAGKVVNLGSTVNLGVRQSTVAKVGVPNVVGLGYGEAHNHIIEAGLKVSPASGINSNWQVTSQSPAANTEVGKGSTVTVHTMAKPPARS